MIHFIQVITEWATVGDTIVGTEVLDTHTAITADIIPHSQSDLEDTGVMVDMTVMEDITTDIMVDTMVEAVDTSTIIRLQEEDQPR